MYVCMRPWIDVIMNGAHSKYSAGEALHMQQLYAHTHCIYIHEYLQLVTTGFAERLQQDNNP